MSNLLKGFYTNQTQERVIDYNKIISDKIESFKSKLEKDNATADGFISGLNADVVEGLIADDVIGGVADTGDGVDVSAITEDNSGASVMPDEQLRELAEGILADANEKAEAILEAARNEAENIKKTAFAQGMEQGKQHGYDEGKLRADMEYQNLLKEFEENKKALEAEYGRRYDAMENEIVETLLEVFASVTRTISEDNKEIVLHLINQVMNKVEVTGEILIKVSKDDYSFVVENQGKIYLASPKDINISIIEDSSIERNQCVVETNGGVFESSLDIQLEQLIKDIRLLSCI